MNPAQEREDRLNAIQKYVKDEDGEVEKDELIKKVAYDFSVTQRKAKEYIETLEGGNVLKEEDGVIVHGGE